MQVIVALGSNLGDRRANLRAGLSVLEELGRVTPSPCTLETPDESGTGPAYINTVALLDSSTDDLPRLLEDLLRLELRLGRLRDGTRNAPRPLDLDIIVAEGQAGHWCWPSPPDLACLGPELTLELPHPRAHGRVFVMEPWRALGEGLSEGLRPPSGA